MYNDQSISTLAALAFPDNLERWQVSDAHLARAYSRTGDRGRAFLKSSIAMLYESLEPGAPTDRKTVKRFRSGLVQRREHSSRPWYLLVLGSEVTSGPQVLAALMPAVVRRIPLIGVLRPRSRPGWAPEVLAALELCGVERIYTPPRAMIGDYIAFLAETCGRGGLACLGSAVFWGRVAPLVQSLRCGPSLWLEPPAALGVWTEPGLDWNIPAIRFAHPQAALTAYGPGEDIGLPRAVAESDFEAFQNAGFSAVYAPAGRRPASARLRLGPGLEAFWGWPEDFSDLLERQRLVYSKD